MFSYLRYFMYIAFNWNVRIAIHIIIREIRGEKKYGIDTTGADELQSLKKQGIDISHATIYMPASYDLLEDLFEKLLLLRKNKKTAIRHFLDIGCGKGRTLCVAAHHGYTKVSGIDFSKKLCDAAIVNVNNVKKRFPDVTFSIINNDALKYAIPEDVDCIFLFNPFDEIVLKSVLKNLMSSVHKHPRDVYILYVNPLHKELFIASGFKEIYHTQKMTYLEAVILTNS